MSATAVTSPRQRSAVSPQQQVAFEEEVPPRKMRARSEEAKIRHAIARGTSTDAMLEREAAAATSAKAKQQTRPKAPLAALENPFSFNLEKYRSTLDAIKRLPSAAALPGPSRGRSASLPDRRPTDARSLCESRASISLSTRSAVQIRADRAFAEGISEHEANMAKPEVIAQTLTDAKPLGTMEGAKRGIGRDVTQAWQGKLREITPQANQGDPVASNVLSRDGVPVQVQQSPGFFAQVSDGLYPSTLRGRRALLGSQRLMVRGVARV